MLLQLALVFSVSLLPGRALQDTRLTVIDIQPCTGSTRTVSRDQSIVYTIYANFSNCPNFTYNSSYVSTCDYIYPCKSSQIQVQDFVLSYTINRLLEYLLTLVKPDLTLLWCLSRGKAGESSLGLFLSSLQSEWSCTENTFCLYVRKLIPGHSIR